VGLLDLSAFSRPVKQLLSELLFGELQVHQDTRNNLLAFFVDIQLEVEDAQPFLSMLSCCPSRPVLMLQSVLGVLTSYVIRTSVKVSRNMISSS